MANYQCVCAKCLQTCLKFKQVMTLVLFSTTWQAGQTRKGFSDLRLLVGNSQALFHTSCGYAFLQNAGISWEVLEEKQKEPEPDTDKNQHLTPVIISSFS
jgi:hypothetical protein